MNAKTGFDKENYPYRLQPNTEGMNERYYLFRQKLSNVPMIKSIGVAQMPLQYHPIFFSRLVT